MWWVQILAGNRKNYVTKLVVSSDGICKYLPYIIYVLVCVRLLFWFVLIVLQHCGKPSTCTEQLNTGANLCAIFIYYWFFVSYCSTSAVLHSNLFGYTCTGCGIKKQPLRKMQFLGNHVI